MPTCLFWVGCAGAFDDRNKKVVYDFAQAACRWPT